MADAISVMNSNVGTAPIIRQGHTADDADGAYPDAPIVGRPTAVRDLNP